ncbi:hypothetical protein XSR1_590013 [Xenorhabdus szentirmaii DSM 16338]|uniref:Uncharacterized protein n=1 Tax=Xenorhabdus szentirmaii DSM 16338 TaxID=1427518 RepID=W1J2H7_9GAMM|nr:hypothetical protein XSR1_590013 [Xenorhabdus szentirmaii DSM 16338]
MVLYLLMSLEQYDLFEQHYCCLLDFGIVNTEGHYGGTVLSMLPYE